MHKLKNRIYGCCRDQLIYETIDKLKCLDSDQLKLLFFSDVSKRQCQYVLNRLSEKKKLIKRSRANLDENYKYFIKDFAQKEHIVLLNWMFLYYLSTHPYEKVYYMEYQRNYGIKVPDLFLVTFNPYQNLFAARWFEMDRTITNEFDAVKKYNKLFESRPRDEFVELTAPRFGDIIIATTDKRRLKEIEKLINDKKVNTNNLKFKVNLIWDVMEECKNANFKDFRSKFIPDSHKHQLRLR